MERTYVELFALQGKKQTRIMAQVPDDPPVCLFAYDRAITNLGSLTAIEMNLDGVPDDVTSFTAIHVTIAGTDVQQR